MVGLVIVHDDAEFREELLRVARKAMSASAPAAVQHVTFADFASARATIDAIKVIGGLIVIGAASPAAAGMRCDTESHTPAIDFIDQAQTDWPHLILLVLSSEENDRALLRHVEQHPNARVVTVGPNLEWKAKLIECAHSAAGTQAPWHVVQRTRAVLRINVFDGGKGAWSLERRGRVGGKLGGPILFNEYELQVMNGEASDLDKLDIYTDWGERMSRVAFRVNQLLFSDPALSAAFDDATRKAEERRNLRLVFGLQPQSHALPVETLKRFGSATTEDQWHALNSPLVRNYASAGCRPPLFMDPQTRYEPVNCLLVAADPRPGVIDKAGVELKLERLDHIEREIEELETLLKAQRVHGIVGEVDALFLSNADDPKAALQAKLAGRNWQLVHFAGHSMRLGARLEQPALVLSPEPGGIFMGAALVRVLRDTRFLFVSSCESADRDFLRLALQESVPAVLGYRWNVDDELARQLALEFYRALFGPGEEQRSLGRALLHARKWMFNNHSDDAMWLSPLLLTQAETEAGWHTSPTARSTSR